MTTTTRFGVKKGAQQVHLTLATPQTGATVAEHCWF